MSIYEKRDAEIVARALSGDSLVSLAQTYDRSVKRIRGIMNEAGYRDGRRRGRGSVPNRHVPLEQRFPHRLEKVAGCWLWTGSANNNGYCSTTVAGHRVYVHRAVYELYRGPIPAGLTIDHLCRNKRCVNPEHLEPVTAVENYLRSVPFRRRRGTGS